MTRDLLVHLGTIMVDEATRRAVRRHFGREGLATRDEIRQFYRSLADADLETIVAEYQEKEATR